ALVATAPAVVVYPWRRTAGGGRPGRRAARCRPATGAVALGAPAAWRRLSAAARYLCLGGSASCCRRGEIPARRRFPCWAGRGLSGILRPRPVPPFSAHLFDVGGDSMARFIFVTGGVVSSLGKGISAASLASLLEARGLRVTMIKMDPYINVDPGTMSPYQHGEVFVTEDGTETDLDLGHYERYIRTRLGR